MAKKAKQEKELTREEKLEYYFNIWGSNKRTLVGICRQLIFLLGAITSLLVATWVIMNALISYVNKDSFITVTGNLSVVCVVFIGFVLALDFMYGITEWIAYNKHKGNRLPSLLVGTAVIIILTTFLILTCVEIYGKHHGVRTYIYCIYLVICFSCCIYSTVYSFDTIKRKQKFNPNNKLLKSLAYTIGFLGILAVIVYILWIMWYSTGKDNLQETCFLLARTVLTLVGSIIVKMGAQLILSFAIKNPSKYKVKRIVYLSLIFATLFGLEMWCGSLFLKDGPYLTAISKCKAAMTVLAIATIGISAIDIGLAGRFSTHLEKE